MGTKKNNLGVRIAMAEIGIALTAVSVGLQKISGLGVDPFSVIIFGLSCDISDRIYCGVCRFAEYSIYF